jgi:MFS family permease
MKLWSAESISQIGTQVTLLALPLTAILLLDASPFEVGLLSSMELAPFLLFGLPAGVWVDRLRRRPILIVGDLGRAVALGSIPAAHAFELLSMPQLYAVAFVTGVCTVFFDVAYQSYLPSLVERRQIMEGNAKLEISRSSAQLAGPGVAGLLIEWLSAPVAILADAISYVGSAAFVGLIRLREPPVPPRPTTERPTMRKEVREGLRYVLRHPLLRPIAACTSLSNLFSSMAFAVLILFAVRRLGLSPGRIGIAFAIGGSGLLLGAFVSDRLAGPIGLGRTIVAATIPFTASAFCFAVADRQSAMALLVTGTFLGGIGSVVYNVNQVSLRQAITPERMQGRMNATMRFIVWGTMPIGSLIGGALGETIGLRPTLWVAAIGGATAMLPPLLSPVRKLRRIPEPDEAYGAGEPAEIGPG